MMKSARLLALTLLSLPMLALPACGLFVGARPSLQTIPPACSKYVPDSWRKGIASAKLANGGLEMGDWIAFSDAQTGQLDKSNGRLSDALSIIEKCETRDAAAVAKATRKKVLGIF